MKLDEALAVYLYLHRRSPGDRTREEDRVFEEAWRVICTTAIDAVERELLKR
jgi:hypothetical protein